ncbi:hypothetical protein BJF92_00680 [Rhizobium rhizosphaerae]|uniref:Uncharacterized protein n=1 Tax=Xaviernesmea rhizosphaerae TaxID=1672749 RepID=A0A1Q9AEJ4_9HYPH|nr:RepB family plasmid replication initiator protein [Xaviernesmea rhizosphaerae]OLP53316.1 hypothetical protein BJF92_00680 [Xaviernesmea rhizosphaerae]
MTKTAFAPGPVGSLLKALGMPGQIMRVAPESPRPVELLSSLTVTGGTTMTADDAALHELLISFAYEIDRGMNGETSAIPMSHVLRYLGQDARRDHVKASLNRLKMTTVTFRHDGAVFEDVPLLVSWLRTTDTADDIVFQLPEPLRIVMSDRARYAYVELAALPAMSSTYSSRVYRRLVAAIAESGKRWEAGGDNVFQVTVTPAELAEWVSFPRSRDGSLHVGKLRERVLSVLPRDFAAVNAFKLSLLTHAGKGRGNPLERIEFRLELAAPSRFKTRLTVEKEDLRYVGGRDVEDLHVESLLWIKAAAQFDVPGRKLLTPRDWWELWLAALNEMNSGVPLSRQCDQRVYRGESLRERIAAVGADTAAWGFVAEEAAEPDLSLRSRDQIRDLGAVGREARASRLTATTTAPEESVTSPVAVGFDEAREIIINVDPRLDAASQTALVFKPITDHVWLGRSAGADKKTLRVRFLDAGQQDEWEVEQPMIEDDVTAILGKIGPYLVGQQEYAA